MRGLFFALLLVTASANALDFYCNGTIVEQGDSMADVKAACGEPAMTSENAWYYPQGPGQLVKVVYFEGGLVDYISEQEPTPSEQEEQEQI